METRRVSSLLMGILLATAIGICPLAAQGGLMAHYDFTGSTGGNVTDLTGNGYDLTGGIWSTANTAEYFKLWSGTVVATANYVPTGAWAVPFSLNGYTIVYWIKSVLRLILDHRPAVRRF